MGAFTTAGGNAANKAARWDTSASSTSNGWSAVGSGVGPTGGNARFNVIAARETTKYSAVMGAVAFVGGSFTAVDGVSASNVAKYTPAVSPAVGTWAPLGTGCNGEQLRRHRAAGPPHRHLHWLDRPCGRANHVGRHGRGSGL